MSDMGIIMSTSYRKSLGIVVSLFVFISIYGQPSTEDSTSLGEAFNAGAPEVEPVVVGRDRWNEKPKNAPSENSSDATDESSQSEESTTTRIGELDPLETQQVKPESSILPIEPPKVPPATRIIRNFEGTLVFKPRTLGFARVFPYQLENAKGKRLAFIDVDQLKAVDPQQFVDSQINVMGKLEAIEEGSDDRVIRARIIRPSN